MAGNPVMHPASLIAAPEVCIATVTTLPTTGADVPGWWILAGLLLITGGIAALVLVRSRRRCDADTTLLTCAGLVLIAGLILAPTATSPAQAASGDVTYSTGCSLIEVDQIDHTSPDAASLLPADTVTVLTATVTNRYTTPITLTSTALLDPVSALTALLEANVTVDGTAGPVTLAAGGSAHVEVTVSLPSTATDEVQGVSTGVTLRLEAAQQ